MESESTLVRHEACEKCGSSDANALYTDGSHYCFSCETYSKPEGEVEKLTTPVKNTTFKPLIGEVLPLNKRKLSLTTCQKWDYQVAEMNGQKVQVANYKDERGAILAQKIRFPNKDFIFLGDTKKVGLFGQHIWRDGGKMLIITEGELDAMSVSQAFDNRWAVVSVSRGAAGAKRDVSKSIDWVEKFDEVIFLFDNDEHGQKAAEECALLITPGKAKLAKLPLKDASDMLQAGRTKELVDEIWGAKVYRPDGIVNGSDLWDLVSNEEDVESVPYPFVGLNEKTLGMRKGEIVTVTAGSGIGKSQLTREFAHHIIKQGHTVGYIALEESVKRSVLGLMAIEANKPLHLGDHELSKEELHDVFTRLTANNSVYFYDHWGSTDSDNLLSKIKYLVRGCGCDFIILDHLSIVVSGMGDGDERRLIDNTMTKLRTLTEELQCGLTLVSHLKRPAGDRGHEEGAATSLAQLRGSAAIAQLSDMVIGLERNQQDSDNPNLTTVRVLKNRWTGETGIACHLAYSKETGRMTETIFEDETEETEF